MTDMSFIDSKATPTAKWGYWYARADKRWMAVKMTKDGVHLRALISEPTHEDILDAIDYEDFN